MQQELLSNPDMLRQVLDNPLVQQMMNDPENMRSLITSNPQMQDLMAVSNFNLLPTYIPARYGYLYLNIKGL